MYPGNPMEILQPPWHHSCAKQGAPFVEKGFFWLATWAHCLLSFHCALAGKAWMCWNSYPPLAAASLQWDPLQPSLIPISSPSTCSCWSWGSAGASPACQHLPHKGLCVSESCTECCRCLPRGSRREWPHPCTCWPLSNAIPWLVGVAAAGEHCWHRSSLFSTRIPRPSLQGCPLQSIPSLP